MCRSFLLYIDWKEWIGSEKTRKGKEKKSKYWARLRSTQHRRRRGRTFDELELGQEARRLAGAARLADKVGSLGVETDAAVVEGAARAEVAGAQLVAAVGRRAPVAELQRAAGVAPRTLVRLFVGLATHTHKQYNTTPVRSFVQLKRKASLTWRQKSTGASLTR